MDGHQDNLVGQQQSEVRTLNALEKRLQRDLHVGHSQTGTGKVKISDTLSGAVKQETRTRERMEWSQP